MSKDSINENLDKFVRWTENNKIIISKTLRIMGLFFIIYPSFLILYIGFSMNWAGNIYLGPFLERVILPMFVGVLLVSLSKFINNLSTKNQPSDL